MNISFVLPGNNRSGGVRVTVIMANMLLKHGFTVRILHPVQKFSIKDKIASLAFSRKKTGWLHSFIGKIEQFSDINEISFQNEEVVFAVGTYMVPYVYRIHDSRIKKVRFNHGLPVDLDVNINEKWTYRKCWNVPMPTVTVSNTLIPQLEKLSGEKVLGVIPNGIDTTEYYQEGIERDGIGVVYSTHPNKAPLDIKKILIKANEILQGVPQYVFGTGIQPKELKHTKYVQLPSVHKAREIYNRSKVWLVPSYTEGLPGTVLEAMACGCAVITSDNEGSLEVVKNGYNGLVVKKGDISGFVTAVKEVITDNELFTKLQGNALKTASEFTWENALCQMLSFLNTYCK